ncbi:MAG: zinc ribbon domain-containing protein [bacterium]
MRIKGEIYPANHNGIISKELYDKVQDQFKAANKPKKVKHSFIYAGLLKCAKCGCAITTELKKGKYIYYHCTGNRGKCEIEFVREEIIDRQVAEILKQLELSENYINEIVKTLKLGNEERKQHHSQALKELRKRQTILQQRIDKAYEDKLDGKINEKTWANKTADWHAEVKDIDIQIAAHNESNYACIESGIKIIELSQKAHELYLEQNSEEKRKLIELTLSNLTLNGSNLHYNWLEPFNLIVNLANHPLKSG